MAHTGGMRLLAAFIAGLPHIDSSLQTRHPWRLGFHPEIQSLVCQCGVTLL
jgi:hypothetical protein